MKPLYDWDKLRGRLVVLETNEGSIMRGRVTRTESDALPIEYVGPGARAAAASLEWVDAVLRPTKIVLDGGDPVSVGLICKLRVVDEGFRPSEQTPPAAG